MKKLPFRFVLFSACSLFACADALADNPLMLDTFAADPTARFFEGKIYLYPSHDIIPPNGGRGFCMEDYHVYSSENLMDWTDHGVIVTQEEVEWVNPNYGMWAPDCVFKDGKYYFYFPANSRGANKRVGVAVADKPYGPFTPEPNYIPDIPPSIDPSVLIDPKDGAAYIFYSMNAIFVAKLKDNMLELETVPVKIDNLPTEGLVEGPFAFERNGKYYLTFPHDVGGGEALEYAMADSPMGPYTMKGTIMGKHADCWTNHHSLVLYKGQWYLFYHYKDLSPRDDTRRSARAEFLTFNDDGTIQPIVPTLRGVGICNAKRNIQIDRYSAVRESGTEVSYLNSDKPGEGWKIALTGKGAFVQYDRVDFREETLKTVILRANASEGGSIELRLDKTDGPLLAKIEIPKDTDWKECSAKLETAPTKQHNLVAVSVGENPVDIDWVRFD